MLNWLFGRCEQNRSAMEEFKYKTLQMQLEARFAEICRAQERTRAAHLANRRRAEQEYSESLRSAK